MQLKGCLLIGFVLNVACLNNLSGKFLNRKYDSLKADSSSLVELFADQISLRKNESLVESLKKDPSSFVELFAKADPERISQIIGILEGLISDAASSLETLRSHQTEATNNLNTANSNVATADTNKETARVALEQATTDKSNADNAYEVAVGEQVSAQLEKQVTDQNYADQSPGLINEHSVLQEVIDTLQSLKDNIAVDSIVTSSSEGWSGNPSKAIDGEHNNGVYIASSTGVCVHTQKESSWIKVQLPQEVSVGLILLAGRRDCCPDQSSGWTVHIGNNGDGSDPICKSNVDASSGDMYTPVRCNSILSGRYVTILSETWMVLCEIEVYES